MRIPKVSVVVATYNYGQYIAQAIASIGAQSCTDWETVIVDDGSTDNTQDVVEPYLKDARFRYVRTEHVGQPAAKNAGIRATCGEFIAFVDADDAWLPEKLAQQLEVFSRDPAIGVVYGRRLFMTPSGQPGVTAECPVYRGDVLPQVFRDNFICFSSAMVRREAFEQCGMFDEQIPLAIDYDLWLRIAAHWKFDYVDEPVVLYRTGHANLSRRGEERLHIALRIMQRFLDEQGGRNALPPAIVRRAFAETYCSLALVQRDDDLSRSLRSYLTAIRFRPIHYAAWRGMFAAIVPEYARRVARRALGRPTDWKGTTRAIRGSHANASE